MTAFPPAVRALISGVIDHSGVFPPTALSLSDAIEKTCAFPMSLNMPSLIGAEMVMPLKDISQVDGKFLSGKQFDQELFRICAINDGMLDLRTYENVLENLAACNAFNLDKANDTPIQRIVSFESKLGDFLSEQEKMWQCLSEIATIAQRSQLTVFVEPDLSSEDVRQRYKILINELYKINNRTGNVVGFKARLTGPSGIGKVILAQVIEEISRNSLPFKVTGGLHHPLPGEHGPYGFLTVALAVAFGRKFKLDSCRILEILESASLRQFDFNHGILWKDLSLKLDEIEHLIHHPHFSIGCCNPSIQDAELFELFH